MSRILLGESIVDERGRVLLPNVLRKYKRIYFYEEQIGDKKIVVVEGEE